MRNSVCNCHLDNVIPHVISINSVHLSLISRVHQFLPSDAKELYPYLLAGAFFPDAFYDCFNGLSPLAEEIHWPDFLALMVKETIYGHHSEEQKTQLKAFIYGIFSHQIADVTWHSLLHQNQGLLRALSAQEFAANLESAHSFLDTSGDWLLLKKLFSNSDGAEITRYFSTEWKYPSKVLLKLFKEMGYFVPQPTLDYCVRRGYSGLQAELGLFDYGSSFSLRESPLLDDYLEEYYLGGLQEMTSSIEICFKGLDQWFENGGPNRNPWTICDCFSRTRTVSKYNNNPHHPTIPMNHGRHEKENKIVNAQTSGSFISPLVPLSYFGDDIEVGEFLGPEYGPCIAVGAQFEERDGSTYVIPLSELLPLSSDFRTISLSEMNYVQLREREAPNHIMNFPSRYGHSMAKYRLLGRDFLLVSSPGSSSLSLYLQNTLIMTMVDKTASKRLGSLGNKQMGIKLQVDDIDGDGVNDIIIASPYSDIRGKPQQGAISIISGEKLMIFLRGSIQQGSTIDISQLLMAFLTLPSQLEVENSYENFGSSISVTRDYLMIGVQSLGCVLMYLKKYIHTSSFNPHFLIQKEGIKDFNQVKTGDIAREISKDSGLFGSSAIINGIYQDMEYFMISAPKQTIEGCIGCGFVKVYIIDNGQPSVITNILLSPSNENAFANFGSSMAITSDSSNVLISAPGFNSNGGGIWKVGMNEIFKSLKDPETENTKLTEGPLILGPNAYCGFGKKIQSVELGQKEFVIVGLPKFGFEELWNDGEKMTGRVAMYEI